MHVHLPNILTFLRLILAPALIIYLIVDKTDSAKFLGMFVFIVIIATDFFDGYLARKFNNVSNFGKVFDPIADKMIIILLLCFFLGIYLNSADDLLICIILILIISREILVSGLREFLGPKGKELRVTMLAKWKTFNQSAMIIILFLDQVYNFSDDLVKNVIYLFCVLSFFITWYTGIGYIKNALYLVQNDKSKN